MNTIPRVIEFGVLVFLFLLASCITDNDDQTTDVAESLLLHQGDSWVHEFSLDQSEYRVTYEVTGENIVDGIECYIVNTAYDPPLAGIVSEATVTMDKENRFVMAVQTPTILKGSPYEVDTSFDYRFDDCQYYPLHTGKECGVTEQKKVLMSNSDIDDSGNVVYLYRTEINKFTYKVDEIEKVTVPAGSFECFRVDTYDNDGALIRTSWKSQELKFLEVKNLNHQTNEVSELVSYSISK